MPLNTKTFAELFTYTRGTGATRVNAAGLIVGVDFSSTSNTIATGSKTFTLTADANVNRDWPVGSSVIAVDQVGGGTMTGMVTSYTPSTQVLVVNVASITGSGTSTNWRIGSLEFRRDFDPITLAPKGGLVEGGATNLFTFSEQLDNAAFTKVNSSISANFATSPSGSLDADKLLEDATNSYHVIVPPSVSVISGSAYTTSFYAKALERNIVQYRSRLNSLPSFFANFDLVSGLVALQSGTGSASMKAVGGGWYLCSVTQVAAISGTNTQSEVSLQQSASAASAAAYLGDGVSGALIWGTQFETSSATSYIPTTTVSVTRAADQLSVGGTNFSQFYNSAQGTLVMELTPIAQAVGAVAGSLNDGTLNNAIRIQQKQSGTAGSIRKMATDGVTDVMAINAATGNTLRSNGVDYIETPDQSGAAKLGVASSGVANFLSVGATENFRNTTDSGLTYNARTIGGTFAGAHFGIGRFVLAGSTATINGATVGSVIVSTDGLALRRVNIAGLTQNLNDVTSNGTNQYVAVGNGGVIYTSPDAETWTAQTSGTATNLTGVHFFGGRYVATSATTNGTRYSDNGTSWTAVTGLPNGMNDVYHNGTNLWVAVGLGGAIYTSADGISYTVRTSNTTQSLNGVHFADGLWVAVGNAGTVVTSPDGTTWTDRTATSGTVQSLNEVNFFGGRFYAVGGNQVVIDNTAANITANVTWVIRSTGLSSTLNGIATNGTRLLICGTSGAITTSDDGTTFTSRTGNAATLTGAAFGAGTYVIAGNAVNGSGLIATVDPVTFAYQRRVSGTTNTITNVRFLGGAFYALHSGSQIQRSADGGASWTTISYTGNPSSVGDIALGNGIYVAVGLSGRYTRSTDGLTFSAAADTVATTQSLNGIDFANGLFVAVGNAGTIITSPNGTTWTLRTSGTTANLFSVMYSTRDAQWYAAGDGGVILRSADAITWENISNDAAAAVISGGIVQSNPFLPNFIVGATNKIAMRIKANDFAASVNGADAVTDTSGSLPSANRFSIGMNGVSGQQFNGHIRKITYFPITKTDAELKGLST